MNAKHTPTQEEWRIGVKEDNPRNGVRIVDVQDVTIATCWKHQGDTPWKAKANAAHIVKCVNMHDELVECLRRLRMHCTDKYDAKQIDDLLLKAKGE